MYGTALQASPAFGGHWRSILEVCSLAMGHAGCEALVETVPAALQAMLLVLNEVGLLVPGVPWVDAHDGVQIDLWDLTWRTSRKISSNLTPELLQRLAAGKAAPTEAPGAGASALPLQAAPGTAAAPEIVHAAAVAAAEEQPPAAEDGGKA